MTWSRQQRHKGLGHTLTSGGATREQDDRTDEALRKLERVNRRPTHGRLPTPREQATAGEHKVSLDRVMAVTDGCECWVRHGQPLPHSATCPAYKHATGPIGDPSDLIR